MHVEQQLGLQRQRWRDLRQWWDADAANCTLTNNTASAGGGVFNAIAGTLTLTNCTLTNNSVRGGGTASGVGGDANGGGIYINGGPLTLTNCTLNGNSAIVGRTGLFDNPGVSASGGGIYSGNGGTLVLESCTLTNNSVTGGASSFGSDPTVGGGIYSNGGTQTLTDCTLSGNSTTFEGGGIYDVDTASLRLERCTLSHNKAPFAGGGIYSNGGTQTLTNCTLSGNSASVGGGVFKANTAIVENTMIVENTIIANSPRGRTCAVESGSEPVQSNGYNLDDDGGCGFFNTGDLSIVPAQLAPLGDYGGPTQTHALCTGPGMPHADCTDASPAIDAGDNAHCPTTDQRGARRPHGSACDIGAYESGAQPPASSCVGDCDGSGSVTVNELITMVNIALGIAQPSACSNSAPSNAAVDIALIVRAVNNALSGCLG